MPNDPPNTCPECGAELPAGTAPGQCPNCLLGLGLATAMAEGQTTEGRGQKSEGGGQKPELGNQIPEAEGQESRAEDPSKPRDPSPATRPSSLVTTLGDYELLEEIGHGGMGVVYKARQKSLDRIVVLKLLLFGSHAPPESVKRFRAEAIATAALQHPNIVAIHEVGLHQGQHFLVMDFVAGPSLARLIGSQPLPARRAAGYVKTIAEAIHYAHEHGFLHRDLKPSNVLIDAHDQPRLTDFGLAKRLEGDPELTVTGQVLGSPSYMPPEQATGKRSTASRRSDVYSLGAILYHALTGRPPFVGEGLADTVQQVLHVEPVPLRVRNPRLPADLETVCLKCLEKEPGKRYATARLLAEELNRFLQGKPVLARPVGRSAKTWRWCRRNPRLALATGAAVLSLLIGLTAVTWQWRRAESQRARAVAEGVIAQRNAYAADMNEAQRALERSDLGGAWELLNRNRPRAKSEADLRGWEWRYLWARCQSEELFPLCRRSNSVTALAFTADGRWLAVRGGEGGVAIWNTVARQPILELPGAGKYKALAISREGNLLAWGNTTAKGTPVVSLWDVNVRREMSQLPHSNDLVSLALSPDAKTLATLASDGIVSVWEVDSQRRLTNFPTAPVDIWAAVLAPIAKETRTSAAEPVLRSWDSGSALSTRTSRAPRKESISRCGCVLFAPDGHWLAVGEAQPRIRLLNRASGERKDILLAAEAEGITTLAFSPDSKLLAAGFGAGDNDVHVWDLETHTEMRFSGHGGWIAGVAFSPDGGTLASVSADQTLRLWDLGRRVEKRRFQGNTDEVWAVAWSPDGKNLVTGAKDGSVRYWDSEIKPVPPYVILPEPICFWGWSFLPDSRTLLAVTTLEGAVAQWDAGAAKRVATLSFLGTNHFSLALSQDGRQLALSDLEGNIEVWNLPARQLVTNLVVQEARVHALWFSMHDRLLCAGAIRSDGRIVVRFWAVDRWREINLQGINVQGLLEGTLSPDDRILAIGYGNGTAAWWELATGKRLAFPICHFSTGVRVRFSPRGTWFATADLDGIMTVWDVATHQPKTMTRGFRNGLRDVVFSPDEQRLIASGSSPQGLVKIWDVDTGREVATLPGEPGNFNHIGFSPDGNTLFAGSLGGTALLWRAPSWEEIDAAEKKQKGP
ncbi:MAG: protein kinase [Verrucomicrobiia bacterium]